MNEDLGETFLSDVIGTTAIFLSTTRLPSIRPNKLVSHPTKKLGGNEKQETKLSMNYHRLILELNKMDEIVDEIHGKEGSPRTSVIWPKYRLALKGQEHHTGDKKSMG